MSVTLPIPDEACGIGNVPDLHFAGLSKRPVGRELKPSFAEALDLLSREISEVLLPLVDSLSASEFEALRRERFPEYCRTVNAITAIVHAWFVNPARRQALAHQGLSAVESHIRENGPERLGVEAAEDVLFSIRTLRRAVRLVPRLAERDINPEKLDEDRKLAQSFNLFSLWCLFHLDALSVLIKNDRRVNIAVLGELTEGARAALHVYSAARQALELRGGPQWPPLEADEASWDAEDDFLARASSDEVEQEEK